MPADLAIYVIPRSRAIFPSAEATRAHVAAPLCILVVDDNLDAAESLAMLLTMMGNRTMTAHDGLQALDVAASSRPDVIFLDI